MKRLNLIILVSILLLFGCNNKVTYSELLNNVTDLKEARNISSKIYNAYKIDTDNYSFVNNLPSRFNIVYAVSTSKNGKIVYNFYSETFDDIGFIYDHDIDTFLMAIEDLDKVENYIFMTKVCDDAYTTAFLSRLADERYDLKEVTDSIVSEREMLLNVIREPLTTTLLEVVPLREP